MSGLVNPEILAGNPVDDVFMDLDKLKFKGQKPTKGLQGLRNESLVVALEMDVNLSFGGFDSLTYPSVFENRDAFQSLRVSFTDEVEEMDVNDLDSEIKNMFKTPKSNMSFIQPVDSLGKSPWTLREQFLLADINLKHSYWKDLFGTSPSTAMFVKETSWGWQGPALNALRPQFDIDRLDDGGVSETDIANNIFWSKWIEAANLALDTLKITHVAGHRPLVDHNSLRNQNREFLLDPNTSSYFGVGEHLARVNRALGKLTKGRYEYFLLDRSKLHSAEFELDGKGNVVVTLPLESKSEEPKQMAYAVIDKSTDALLEFDDVGSGLSDVLPVLAALTSESYGLVYVEQPELHLHPKMQMELAEIVVDSVAGKQIIIETHSENFLIGIQRLIRLGKISANDVAVLYAEPNPEKPEMGNHVFNLSLDNWGDLLDPFPESFVDLRAHYIFDSGTDE